MAPADLSALKEHKMNDYGRNFMAPKVDIHQFSMVPKADIPRSTFRKQSQHKTTINASTLIPIFIEEILPGDTFNCSMTGFIRMQTPVYPIMDNIDLESWFFFVPCRIMWSHWENFMGSQPNTPADSISYTIPVITPQAGGFNTGSIYDYFGIPCSGQASAAGGSMAVINALPFRSYNKIVNEWFKDQNLQNSVGYGATNSITDIGDGPDPYTNYNLFNLAKRPDYFTTCLPWTQKGGTPIPMITGSATVKTASVAAYTGAQNALQLLTAAGATPAANMQYGTATGGGNLAYTATAAGAATAQVYPSNLYADMSTLASNTINALRLAFQTQRLLERDARGGTRYVESILAHFGVRSPDFRHQRPEYLGGGRSPINIAPVPQTSATGLTGGTSPIGTLSGVGTGIMKNHGFRQSFTEHGYVIGLVAVRADELYQQGLRRLWTRQTRYDFYYPVFANLGEQAVALSELYCVGGAGDTTAFGYQERWSEYRYHPSLTTGRFNSTAATPDDPWHLANKYTAAPALNGTFITSPLQNILDRTLSLGASARTLNQQFLCDFFFDVKCARPMPMYSVPGKVDHF